MRSASFSERSRTRCCASRPRPARGWRRCSKRSCGRSAGRRDALGKLALNAAAPSYERETSQALGFGFRCGFLGLLHMDIVRERLEREYDLELLATTPNVEYRVTVHGDEELRVHSPTD